MSRIEWSSSLEVGDPLIDSQHKELFNRVNMLFDACASKKGREETAKLLAFLAEYVQFHFKAEESVQQKFAFPGYLRHKQMHDEFTRVISSYQHDIATGGPTLTQVMAIAQTAADWLVTHIGHEDTKVAAHLKTGKNKPN